MSCEIRHCESGDGLGRVESHPGTSPTSPNARIRYLRRTCARIHMCLSKSIHTQYFPRLADGGRRVDNGGNLPSASLLPAPGKERCAQTRRSGDSAASFSATRLLASRSVGGYEEVGARGGGCVSPSLAAQHAGRGPPADVRVDR